MQLGSVTKVFQQPYTASTGDADAGIYPDKKKDLIESPDVLDVPLAAYSQIIIQRRENASLQIGLSGMDAKWSGLDVSAKQRHSLSNAWPAASVTQQKSPQTTAKSDRITGPSKAGHGSPDGYELFSDMQTAATRVIKSAFIQPVTLPSSPAMSGEIHNQYRLQATPVSPASDASSSLINNDVRDKAPANSLSYAGETGKQEVLKDDRRRAELAIDFLPRQITGQHGVLPAMNKPVQLAQPGSRREFIAPEMMHNRAENIEPLASGETRISWTFRRWQPSGDHNVRISLLPDASSQMVMTPSTSDLADRLDVARLAEGAPDYVLRDERGQEQNSRQHQTEQQEEEEV